MNRVLLTELARGAATAAKKGHRLCANVCCASKELKNCTKRVMLAQREDVVVMKKSTLIAWVAFFSAVAGALAAAYFYIQRREKELDEYEQLLFSEDFCDEAPVELDELYDLEQTDADAVEE